MQILSEILLVAEAQEPELLAALCRHLKEGPSFAAESSVAGGADQTAEAKQQLVLQPDCSYTPGLSRSSTSYPTEQILSLEQAPQESH
eukprot:s2695_g9.t1